MVIAACKGWLEPAGPAGPCGPVGPGGPASKEFSNEMLLEPPFVIDTLFELLEPERLKLPFEESVIDKDPTLEPDTDTLLDTEELVTNFISELPPDKDTFTDPLEEDTDILDG